MRIDIPRKIDVYPHLPFHSLFWWFIFSPLFPSRSDDVHVFSPSSAQQSSDIGLAHTICERRHHQNSLHIKDPLNEKKVGTHSKSRPKKTSPHTKKNFLHFLSKLLELINTTSPQAKAKPKQPMNSTLPVLLSKMAPTSSK